MIETTPEIFYSKLLSAMEAGNNKGEQTLLERLSQKFNLQNEPDIKSALVEKVPPEDAMVWLLSESQPFVKMLDEIYHFLSDTDATILGNADQFSFHFDEINERISFPLDSFPKTYIKALSNIRVLTTSFNPVAKGFLMIDTPNYWREDVPALQNLSFHPALHPDYFALQPPHYQKCIAERVETALQILEEKYVTFTPSEESYRTYVAQFERLYFANEALLQELHRLLADMPSRNRIMSAWEDKTYDFLDEGFRSGTIVNAERFDRFVDKLPKSSSGTEIEKINFPKEGHDSNLTYAFAQAFDLCFPPSTSIVQDYIDVIDKVFLPFYRHRWRLFEVWSILWARDTIPHSRRPRPHLTPRADNGSYFEWIIPGGDARSPVATWINEEQILEIWCQHKTSLSPEEAAQFGQDHIEPDLKVRGGKVGHTVDLAILEVKDRFEAQGSEEKKVARMYSTTKAPLVCIANYSEFKALALRGKIYREIAGDTEILIVDKFMPGNIPLEVAQSFRQAICKSFIEFDLIGDVSGSADSETLQRCIQAINDTGAFPARLFAFNNDLIELSEGAEKQWPSGGGTNLTTALDSYLNLKIRSKDAKIVILTDPEGLEQFNRIKATNKYAELDMLCLDLNEELDLPVFLEWTRRLA